MKLFVSWSGQESRVVAENLRSWLILFFPSLEIWVSSVDIVPGDRWHQILTNELSSTELGIICLNRENLASPWVLFEAGALSKSLEQGRVIPFLTDIDFSEIPDPLKYFQAVRNDRDGLRAVVQSISLLLTENFRKDDGTDLIFEALFEKFGNIYQAEFQNNHQLNPLVEFYRSNGLIVLIDQRKVTLTEREYVLFLFFCDRSEKGMPSFPYYKAVPRSFSAWLKEMKGGAIEGRHHWDYLLEHREGFTEIQKTVSSIKKKLASLQLGTTESDLIPQRGRIGVNVQLKQDVF